MTIIFRNGKAVTYNEGFTADWGETKGWVVIRKKGHPRTFLAIIPAEVIERIDGVTPCSVRCEPVATR